MPTLRRFVLVPAMRLVFGTGSVKSIGTAASNGCVRMFDRDAVALYDLVKEGTRVRVID